MDAVNQARHFLDLYARTLTREEMPTAAAAFSRTIWEVGTGLMGTPEAVALLRRACEVFPYSARMADLLGKSLRLAGKHEEAYEQHARALDIRRTAFGYQTDFPSEDAAIHHWEFAENIRRWTGAEQG
jgi:tetratricopeptide (TPR) repeat protein